MRTLGNMIVVYLCAINEREFCVTFSGFLTTELGCLFANLYVPALGSV
jgi:hypothetical protein